MTRATPARPLGLALLLCLGIAAAAHAAAPEPAAPVDIDRFMGRWYDILRTPNDQQKNCYAAYQVWSRKGAGYSVRQVCHKNSADGPESVLTISPKPLNADNTKWVVNFFGGILSVRYHVTDHDPAYSWMIATTEDGKFPKVLSREPSMSPALQATLKARMSQLGFKTDGMQYVGK